MTKPEAIQFLAQVAQDFLAQLPLSTREPFRQAAQQAINELNRIDQPAEPKP